MTPNLNEEKIREINKIKKRRGIKYLIIFSIISLLTVAAIVIWKIQRDIDDIYSPTQSRQQAETGAAKMSNLVGQWRRMDGGYVIEIRAVDASGILDAAYYNPRPINISQSKVKDAGGMLEVFIELWDENYPGSTYNLVYDPIQDILYGTYFTPVTGQTFEVIFVRMEN